MKLVLVLISSMALVAACSKDSGSGKGATLRSASLEGEKEITQEEYSKETSSWYAENCYSDFATNLIGNVFRREERFQSSQLSYFTQTTESVSGATPDQVTMDLFYNAATLGGFSGQIFTNNSGVRICTRTKDSDGTRIDCKTDNQVTQEAANYVRTLPENPIDKCEYKEALPSPKPQYFKGDYVFENGTKVSAVREFATYIANYNCEGKVQQRTTIINHKYSNAVKAYPGDSNCRVELYSSYKAFAANGASLMDSETTTLQAPRK